MPVDLKKHQRLFFERAQQDIAKALTTLKALKENDSLLQPDDIEKLRPIYRCFHSMKGTSGMLQLDDIYAAAGSVEDRLEKIVNGGIVPDLKMLSEIETAAKDILDSIPPLS